jgi:uncharacterized protein (DUF1499 family)
MRHIIIEEPFSEAALWSRRLAVFAVLVAAIGTILTRTGLEPAAAFAVVGSAVMIACLAVLCASAAFVSIWQTGRKGVGLSVVGLVLGLLLLAYPAYLTAAAIYLPVLSDVTTDLENPPEFSLSRKALELRHGFRPAAATPAMRALQAQKYPDIQPLLLEVEADAAYQIVLRAISQRGWTIIDDIPPGRRSGLRHIDALATGPLLGFPDDVTIRIRPLAGQTIIDVRSASRFGRHDFGANARRIQAFLDDVNNQSESK